MGPTTPYRKKRKVTETATNEYPNTPLGPAEDSSQPTGSMTAPDESPRREVRNTTTSLLGPKTQIRLGTWNVRTMYETSRLAQVLKEMDNYQLDILGVSECRWTGSGKITTATGSTMLYSGHPDSHTHGVALIISKHKANTLLEWEPVSERLIRARFNSKYCKLTIIQCYAPTNEATDEDKDEWYEQLQRLVSKVPQHDMLLIIGDMNAKVGNNNTNYEKAMGTHGCGDMNDNGSRLADFCMNNSGVIGGTIFPHKKIHKLTWKSPDGTTVNQIDHIIVNSKWRSSLSDVRVFRGADVYSDHHLLTAKITLKLRKAPQETSHRKKTDVGKLKDPITRQEFVLHLRNRFSALEDILDTEDTSIDSMWSEIKAAYCKTGEEVLGFVKKKKDKEWITPETRLLIGERKKLKGKLLSTRSPRLVERVQKEYSEKNKEVKKSARRDKRAYMEEIAEEAEEAARRGDLGAVYKITKKLCGQSSSQAVPVKDKHGNTISTESEQADRWVQHFQEVLNRPDPDDPADPEEAEIILDIDTSEPTEAEVTAAIRRMKSGKAAGIDSIHAEMMQADMVTSTRVLTALFSKVWSDEAIPADWCKGLVVKLPKKGNLQNCDNWRGITLLSIPSKIFCRVLLDRIQKSVDATLRKEQAGFRQGRGCTDQIFALRNIMEQCIEWNAPVAINFIDFKKAFDSVHRETLWKILLSYGIPPKIVTLVKKFYNNFECSVIVNGKLTEWFSVESGVRQGCIISPILFLITIDWIMRRTTADKARGIQWSFFSHLEDLDFADDLAILSTTHKQLQEKTDRLTSYAKQTGLNINTTKTQVMNINPKQVEHITVDGSPLENVDEFTYLGSLISSDNGVKKDIQARLGKARSAFARLRPVWRSSQYSLKTKAKLYNSNVKSVLLYGSECWRVTKSDMNKIDVFHNSCLRQICRIFWPQKISNEELYKKTGCKNVTTEIKRRRFKWLGHVLRMDPDSIPRTALRWTPQGKRKRGRPKTTWRRTVESELKELGITWGEAQKRAKDRNDWRSIVVALCSTGNEED
jgi:hypothetical protein